MFNKILLGTDLSPASEVLVQCAGEMKSLGLEDVILAHIIHVTHTPSLEGGLARKARPYVEHQKEVLERQGIKVSIEMPLGIPAPALNDLAEKHEVSAIIIGSHGKGLATSLTLGSVSSKLLQITQRPVLLARTKLLEDEEECLRECRNLFAHVLYPTDFSDTAERAFTYLEAVVSALKCPVTLMHVRNHAEVAPHLAHRLEELRRLDSARLERMKIRLKTLGTVQVTIELPVGTAGEEIVERAKAKDCSLILMGTRGKGLVREIVLGSVAHHVSRHAGLPVLLIPPIH
ncbi:MAG: universal stress protein [Desulfovibrionales bacterium]|nr:universal stress protein [Desulfovibrionales bacterium]